MCVCVCVCVCVYVCVYVCVPLFIYYEVPGKKNQNQKRKAKNTPKERLERQC